jgi:hypothetical protein
MRVASSSTPWGRLGIEPDVAEVTDTDLDGTAHFDRDRRGTFHCVIQTRPYRRSEATGSTAVEAYRTALRNLLDDSEVAA